MILKQTPLRAVSVFVSPDIKSRDTVMEFMDRASALCVRTRGELASVLLFSREPPMLRFLAAAPEQPQKGLAQGAARGYDKGAAGPADI